MRGHPARPAPGSQPSLGAPAAPETEGFARGHGGRHTGRQRHGRRRCGGERSPSPGPAAASQPHSHPDRAGSEGLSPPPSFQGDKGAIVAGLGPCQPPLSSRGRAGAGRAGTAPLAAAAPQGMKRVSGVFVGPGGPALLIRPCESPPVGIYPGIGCYRHHPGQQVAHRHREGDPMLQSP